MMKGKQTATLLILSLGLVLGIVPGCGGTFQVNSVESALEEGNYEGALTKIEEALQEDSADTDALLLRARVLRTMADSTMRPDQYKNLHSRAREAEEQALSFDAKLQKDVRAKRTQVFAQEMERGKLAYNRANKRGDQPRYRQAASHYGAAGATQPDSARPVLNEAFSRLRIGQRENVIPVLEQYVERADMASSRAYKILGQLYLDYGQSQEAIDLLDQGVRTHPTIQKLQSLRLNAYNKAGEGDEALTAYRKEVEREPENALYRYNYGALLLKAERYADAIEQLKRAVDIEPTHVESQYNLGAAYMNAALIRDDSIAALERRKKALRSPSVDTLASDTLASDTLAADTTVAGTPTLDNATSDTTELDQRIQILVQRREELFREAISPLERVRKMDDTPSTIRQDACRALMVAYVQTNRPRRAAQVEECTGFSEARR